MDKEMLLELIDTLGSASKADSKTKT
jgi:hypothetical protein